MLELTPKNLNEFNWPKKAVWILLFVFLVGSNSASSAFSDVGSNIWYFNYVNILSEKQVIKGYPDGLFRPAEKLSYIELVVLIVRGYEKSRDKSLLFDYRIDQHGGKAWYTEYLLKSKNIVGSDGGDIYSYLVTKMRLRKEELDCGNASVLNTCNEFLSKSIPRIHMAEMAYFARTYYSEGEAYAVGGSAPFIDTTLSDYSSTTLARLGLLKTNGILTGAKSTEFYPEVTLNRAEASKVICKIYEICNGNNSMSLFMYVGGSGLGYVTAKTESGAEYVCSTRASNANNCLLNEVEAEYITLTAHPERDSKFFGWAGACISVVGNTCVLRKRNSSQFVAAGFDSTKSAEVRNVDDVEIFELVSKAVVNAEEALGELDGVIEYLDNSVETLRASNFVFRRITAAKAFHRYKWLTGEMVLNRNGKLRGMVISRELRTVFEMSSKTGAILEKAALQLDKAGKVVGNAVIAIDFFKNMVAQINSGEGIGELSASKKAEFYINAVTDSAGISLARIGISTFGTANYVLRKTKYVNVCYWTDVLLNDGMEFEKTLQISKWIKNDMDKRVSTLSVTEAGSEAVYTLVEVSSDAISTAAMGVLNE